MLGLTVLAMFLRPRGPTVDYLRRVAGAISHAAGSKLRLIAGDRRSTLIAPDSFIFGDELLRCRQPISVEQFEAEMLSKNRLLLITDYPNLVTLLARYCGDLDELEDVIIVNLSDFDPPRSPLTRWPSYLPYSSRIPDLLIDQLNRLLDPKLRRPVGSASLELIQKMVVEVRRHHFEAPRLGAAVIEKIWPIWLRNAYQLDELVATVVPLITDHRPQICEAVFQRAADIVDSVGHPDDRLPSPGESDRAGYYSRLTDAQLTPIGESLLRLADQPELVIASPVYRHRKLFEPFGLDRLTETLVVPESPGHRSLYVEFNGESLDPLFGLLATGSPLTPLIEERILEYAPTLLEPGSEQSARHRFIHRRLLAKTGFDPAVYRLIDDYCRTEMSPQIRKMLLIDLLGVGSAIARRVRPAPRAEIRNPEIVEQLLINIERNWKIELIDQLPALLEQPRRLFEESFGLELSRDGVSLREMRRLTEPFFS